jgi:hypothetical protein
MIIMMTADIVYMEIKLLMPDLHINSRAAMNAATLRMFDFKCYLRPLKDEYTYNCKRLQQA